MSMHEPAGTDRRTFYLTSIYGLWAVMSAALGIPAIVYLLFPPKLKKGVQWVNAANLSKLPPGIPEEVTFPRRRVDGWKVISEKATAWVVKKSETEAIAFAPQCTHLGCAYHWEDRSKTFLCPCHASVFSIDGNVLSGPAPRALDRYEVKISGNTLQLGQVKRSDLA